MNVVLMAAAGMALVTFAVHTFVGTRFAVPDLIGAGEKLPKAAWTQRKTGCPAR